MSLSRRKPPVIAAKQSTSVIPIVFATAGDPVGNGLVASASRDRAATSPACRPSRRDLVGKRLELLREVVPVSAGWQSWPMLRSHWPRRKWARFKLQRARSASTFAPLDNPASGRYRARLRGAQGAARRRFMSLATRSLRTQPSRINTFALAARLPTIHANANMSKREV